jgi:phage shock protein A
MTRPVSEVLVLAIGFAILLVVGCEQEAPSEKKSRLIAAENIKLKNALEQRAKEVERLKAQHAEERRQQEESLAGCQKQKEDLQEKLRQGVKKQVDEVLTAVVEENAKLREEVKNLKAEVEKLKQKIEVKARPLETP